MARSAVDARAIRDHATDAARFLKTVSNPVRLIVLCALIDGEHSAGELTDLTELSPSALSQHLALLRRAGLVTTRRDAQTIYYALGDADVHTLMRCLHSIFCE